MTSQGSAPKHNGDLGERLRQRRKVRDLTAKNLARLAGVSPAYVSQLEHGKQDQPSLDVLGRLAAVLDTSVAELLGAPVTALAVLEHAAARPISPALAALADEMSLDAETTAMLSLIRLECHQPATREGWLLVLLAIRAACAEGMEASRLRA